MVLRAKIFRPIRCSSADLSSLEIAVVVAVGKAGWRLLRT